jgi:hypothetical protein
MKRKDQISGVFWLVVSFIVIQQSLSMRLGTLRHPGPGLIPFILGITLAVLSLMLVLNASLRGTENANRVQLNVNWSSLGKLGLIIGVLLAFAFTFQHLGFFFSSFWVLIFLFRDPRKWWIPLFGAALTVILGFLLFHVLLQIPFPRGPFGIK